MASIPMTAHSATKVRKHIQQRYENEEEASDPKFENPFRNVEFALGKDLVLPNYNSKMMNSIWGMYNLYAAHAFQKNNEGSHIVANCFPIPQAKTFSLWDFVRSRY